MDKTDLAERPPIVLGDPGDNQVPKSNPLWLLIPVGLLGWLWMAAGPRTFLIAVGLIVMIFLHELGHFVTARWTGMKVTQFFLFMGPRLWSFQRGEVEYGIRMLPLGAFVRIIGMHNLDPVEAVDEPRTFRSKSYRARMLVMTAGSMMHFIQAAVLFLVVTAGIGLNDTSKWSIETLVVELESGEQAPAVMAGLAPGDDILTIDSFDATNWQETVEYIVARPGQTVSMTVDRGGEVFETSVELISQQRDGEMVGFLGVAPGFERTRELLPTKAISLFGNTMWQAIESIPKFFAPSTFLNLGRTILGMETDMAENERPVSLVGATRYAGDPSFDVTVPIMMLGVFNVFIGVLNLVPLPPLDGGHVAIATYEKIRSRKGQRYHADIAKLLPLTYAVVLILGCLMISTIYLDIVRPLG